MTKEIMLPKNRRLNLKKDFNWMASGKKIEDNLVKIFWRPGEHSEPHIGIALSSTTFRKAHERNRAKRLVSLGFEQLYAKIVDNANIMALPKVEVLKSRSKDIQLALERILGKAGLLKT